LADAAETAQKGPPETGLEVFLRTVGLELAENRGLSAPVWGELAPIPLVEHLGRLSTQLLEGAQRAGSVSQRVTPDDVAAAVWALRGVIQSEQIDVRRRGRKLWQRHLETILLGFRHST
jgi:hypothetical protein